MSFSIEPLSRNAFDSTGKRLESQLQLANETSFENELAALQIGETESAAGLSDFSNLTGERDSDANTFVQEADLLQRLKACIANREPGFRAQVQEPRTTGTVRIPPNIQADGCQQFAAQNNNPGNLMFARQPGATLGVGGFAQFATPEDGYHALIRQVQLDAGRGMTLAQYITKYAPPAFNDTALYIQQAGQTLGVDAATPLSSIDPNDVAAFQARKESGTTIL